MVSKNIDCKLYHLDVNALEIVSVLCCQTPPKLQSQLFKFKSGLFVSNSRLQRMHDTPWLSLLHTIVEKLQVPTRILDTCIEITKELPPELMPFNNVFFSGKYFSTFIIQ